MRRAFAGNSTSSRIVIGLLSLVLIPLYVSFRSISLDDFDSYSFVLALDNFSLALQQPQPPGFPIYIVLGRLLRAILQHPTTALTVLSALGGVTTALCIYALGKASSPWGRLVGAGAALLVALSPLGWLTAEKALSDSPGMALTLLSLLCLWKGKDAPRWFLVGCLVTGLAMGVRPQNNLPVLLLLAGISIRHIWLRRPFRLLVWGALISIGGLLLWLLPTLRSAGGLDAYLGYLSAHSAHVRETDSLFANGWPDWLTFRARAIAFGDTFLMHTIGVGLYTPWAWPQIWRALAAVLVLIPGVIKAGWRRHETRLLATWFLLSAGQVFALEILDRPRLMLPILPPLALLIASGWARLDRPRWLAPTVLTAATFALLLQGIPLAALISHMPAPPAQATSYVLEHFPPQQTIIAAGGSFRSAQVELPAYQLIYLYEFDPAAARGVVAQEHVQFVVVLDRDQFPTDAIAALTDDGRFVPIEDHTFVRDPRVHTQHDRVRLQVLTPAELLPPQALALPEDGCIDIGSDSDGRYVDQGWYSTEEIGGTWGRWAGGTPTTTLHVYLPQERNYLLTLKALAFPAGQTLGVRVNGQAVTQVSLVQVWDQISIPIPAELIPPEGVATLELVHSRLTSPYDESDGASSDRRLLAAAYDTICLTVEP